jgi:hypothetical protein
MKSFIAGLLLLAAGSSCGADLTPVRQDAELGVSIQGVEFPPSLARDLTSGLTNRLLIRVSLEEAAQSVRRRVADIAIRYDLWDESFTIVTRIDDVAVSTRTQQSMQQVTELLQHVRLPRLFQVGTLRSANELVVQAELLLNPIDRERMENIKKWVAQNSSRQPLDPSRVLGHGDGSLSNAIFNRILEQYAAGSDVSAAWQQSLRTQSFSLDSVRRVDAEND